MFLYDFATKTAQKPDTVATYIRRNEKIFKNHVERREKQLWLDEKAVKILLKKYPEVQRKKYPWWKNETEFEEAMVNAIKGLWDNQEILRKELDGILTAIAELQDAMDQKEPQKENNGLISLEELFGEDEDTQIDKLKRQVQENERCSIDQKLYQRNHAFNERRCFLGGNPAGTCSEIHRGKEFLRIVHHGIVHGGT